MLSQNNRINPVHLLQSKLGWTIEKIAEEMDYSVSAVSKWSSGDRNPSPRAMKEAQKVLANYITN
jgi:transcriptional regulator with XRE-family HTH domain